MSQKRTKGFARVAAAAAFFALLFAAVALTSRVMELKDSREKFAPFLEEPSRYDVLILGNSHIANAVYPMELWRDYGIRAYNLSSVGNTAAVTYWTFVNALERGASPVAVVVDVDEVGRWEKTSTAEDVHRAIDWLPLSRVKAEAIRDLTSGEAFDGQRWEYFFTLGKYHERWSELTADDFFPQASPNKGAEMRVGVAQPQEYQIYDWFRWVDGERTGYGYLRALIELCQERGIRVLLTHVPFPATEYEQDSVNAVPNVAEDYGVEYVDFVSMDCVTDYRTDMYDPFSHLNPSGARKVSDYVGQILARRYGVPDARDGGDAERWRAEYGAYADLKLKLLCSQTDAAGALMMLHDADLSAVLCVPEGSALYGDERLLRLMQNVAREHVHEDVARAAWSDAIMPLEQLDLAAEHGAPYFALIDRRGGGWTPDVQERLGTGKDAIDASFGEVAYRSDGDGQRVSLNGETVFEAGGGYTAALCIAVIDERTGEVAAVLSYDAQSLQDGAPDAREEEGA